MHNRSEEELRQSIEESRTRLSETVEEIGARVNPDRVQREIKARARGEVDEFKATVKQKARSTMRDLEHEAEVRGRGMWRTIKDNPVPATMMGVGLAWMVANSSRSEGDSHRRTGVGVYGGTAPLATGYPAEYGYGYDVEPGPRRPMARTEAEIRVGSESGGSTSEVKERAEEMAEDVREKGSEAMNTAEERAQHAMDATREKTAELSEKGREQARHARHKAEEWTDQLQHRADQVQHRAMRAERRVEDAVKENPLAAGAMAAALGFAAGLMVPETQREHEMMGSTRDRMLDRAQESAGQAVDRARDTARETAGKVAQKAVDEAFPGGDGSEKDAMTEPGRG